MIKWRHLFLFLDAASVRKQALLLEEVQKLNRENAERAVSPKGSEADEHLSQNLLHFILEQEKAPEVENEELFADVRESLTELKEEEEKADKEKAEDHQDEEDEAVNKSEEEIKEELEDSSKEDDCAMLDVKEDENFGTPQRCLG